jgi:integrase
MVLAAPARQILAEMITDRQEYGYVFPSRRAVKGANDRPYAGLKGFWDAVRKTAKLGDTRIHDLRHTHASVGVSGGVSLLMVGKLLGHAQTSTTERYAHLADDPLRQAADFVGNRIAQALVGKPE